MPSSNTKGGCPMKGKSHRLLAQYLIDQYLSGQPRRCTRAFLLGCVQPDRNPTTYLKGSFREQWLRGHNWGNSQRYMQRLCRRLERKRKLGMLSCYNLGKLVHYTTPSGTAMDTIRSYHRDYVAKPFHIRNDSRYTVAVCCCVLCMLIP